MNAVILPCTTLAVKATYRFASGYTRWARLKIFSLQTIMAGRLCTWHAKKGICQYVNGYTR